MSGEKLVVSQNSVLNYYFIVINNLYYRQNILLEFYSYTSNCHCPFFEKSEIWDALRAAAEADLSLAQAIVDSAGVIVQSADLTICYDERGTLLFINFLKYQHILYKYVTEVLVETYVFLSYFYCCALQIHLAGAKYELPKYVLSEPTNLIREGQVKEQRDTEYLVSAKIDCKSCIFL